MSRNIFVFVVCGAREHLDTLHFSLGYLKKRSNNEIWVITDTLRNETEIDHDVVLDVRTPQEYDNHEASIYLKTGIHHFLPKGNNYCYLDTDVIALTNEIDKIFEEFISPIRFAPDHCRMDKFSSSAVNCGCGERREKTRIVFSALMESLQRHKIDPETVQKRTQLEQYFAEINSTVLKKIFYAIRFHTSSRYFKLNTSFYFDKKNRAWRDTHDKVIMYESYTKEIEKETDYVYDEATDSWKDQSGNDIWSDECQHLAEKIQQTFQVKVGEKSWQHWNGGVFLFNDQSHDFLEAWHLKTRQIFELRDWKTRDQGTLIATVWEFGLQDHLCLNKKWNFLADSNNDKMLFKPDGTFTDDRWQHEFKVNFIHVYHRFGDKSWALWNFILTA